MNKFKIGLITILGICLLYFTSSIFDYKTEQKNNISSKTKDNHNIIQENNMVVTNNVPRAFLTEPKSKKNFKKETDEDYKKELAEKEEFERERKDIETQDAPEKAVEQDFERTKDPALNRPTPEVLPGVILNSAIQSFSGALMGLPGAGASTSWIQRGPNNIGGRTRALAWDPNDGTGKKIWAGGVSGGLWYNNDITNAASNWVNVGDVWANLAITKIAFDPNNAQNIYVSTGEGYQVGATKGAGIWKSTNGGTSFSQLSSTTGMTYMNDLVVRNESGTSVVYAAVDGNYYQGSYSIYEYTGLYRSLNGGTSWTQVLPINTGVSCNCVPYTPSSLSIGADNRLWVGTKATPYSGTDRGGGRVLYSDNGTSWPIAKSVDVTNGRGRVTVATAPSDANYVYAFVETNTTGGVSTISLIKSSDKGATWSDMALPDDVDNGISATDFSRGQAGYDQVLKVDPNFPQTVYVGAIDLFKSTDAGANWTQISKWSNNPGMGSIDRLSYVHADQHAMEFKPGSSSIGIFGNDGGVFYSSDLTNASTASVINARNANYNVTQFYAAAIHPTANTNYYLAGSQDNGTQKFTSAGLGSTSEATGGDGAYCFIDQTNPNYQITSYVYNYIYGSNDGGASFSQILSENTGSFINPATYDNNLHIYYSYKNNDGTNGVIKRITGINATTSVSDVSITGLNTSITAFKVSPHTTGSTTLFIGTSNSKLIKVTNADGTPSSTTLSTTGFPANASISSIDIGVSENELLVTFFNYGVNKIWYTSNGGTTWSNKMGDFPNIPARWGMFNPSNRANDVLLATELGIYGTTNFSNANPTWSQLNNGFTNVRTDMLQYRASDKQVIAATHGRGLYSSNGFAVTPSITSFTPTTASTGTTVTITGTDFDAITNISFGGVAAASYTVTSLTSITAVVAGGASGNIAVTNSAGTGLLAGFTYCATANASLTSGVNSNNQTVCQNTSISSITYSTTNVTGVTITGVPSLTASYNANVVTISGAPPSAGVYTFTVAFTGGCETITATGTITVTASNTLTLSSAAGTNSQSVCINNAITSVTYTSTGATTATVTGLPTGVSYTWAANVVTITGTPTVTGTYNYTLTTSGGCGPNTATGTIIVNQNTITISSDASTASQTICNNTPIVNITYNTTGATAASVTGLPGGVTGTWVANVFTISGTPTPTSGNFTYTISLTGGCGTITKTGTITIQPTNALTLSSGAGTNSQTVCIGTAIVSTTYTTTGATNATVTGLPTGITSSWSANVLTISGTPTVAGNYTYTVTTVGGCGVITATGTFVVDQNTIVLSSAIGTDVQTICSGTSITSITYTTTGATNATFNGLPGGLIASWSANTITISGTPTPTNGTFNYTITLTGGCGTVTKTGTIIISFPNTITLGSAAGTNSQTICINTSSTPIIYNTTDATGATVTGLPAGLSGLWSNNVYTINGIPTASGTYSYTVTTTGGCGVASTTGKYAVTPANTFTLTSAAGTNTQTVCVNNAISNITYATTGATNVTVTGLPTGVTSSWAANILTISGTPTATGTYNYTMTTIGGCGPTTATGTITVKRNTITLSSAAGTDSQTICINSAIIATTYTTTGATNATVTGLPTGITSSWSANVLTISGTPTVAGNYTYTVTTVGGCGVITATGNFVVNQNTIALSSATGTDVQTICSGTSITSITFTTTGATGANFNGLPGGLIASWSANTITISGTPTPTNGTFNYTITPTGGCQTITATGTITVTASNTLTLSSAAGTNSQSVCINNAITSVTYTSTGATNATVTGLPTGITSSWSANVLTISGTPTVAGNYTYTVTTVGGCGVITATGNFVVNQNTIALSSATGTDVQTICSGTSITSITYTTTGATGASITGLPGGVTGTWSANVITISGTPTPTSDNFTYTITLTGGCGTITRTGTLTIQPTPNAPDISNANITKFCNGDSVKLSSTIATGLIWYNNDVLIPAQTASTYYVKATGTYSAKVFVSGCPSANSNIITIDRIELPITPVVTDVSLCKDATPVTLNAITTTGNTLLWYGTNATGGTSSTNANFITTSAIGTSNYYVSQKSTFGCESIRVKIAVNIYGIPSAPSITRNNTNNLISSYTHGNTWYKDQVKLADTSNMIKPLEQGSYTVKAIVNTCPSSFSMPYFYLNSVTDITNLNQSEFIKIYPNPIVSDLKINFSLTKFQKVNVAIYSSTSGRKIIDLMNKESGMTIDIRNLISGTYIVIISSKDNQVIYTQKIMKL